MKRAIASILPLLVLAALTTGTLLVPSQKTEGVMCGGCMECIDYPDNKREYHEGVWVCAGYSAYGCSCHFNTDYGCVWYLQGPCTLYPDCP